MGLKMPTVYIPQITMRNRDPDKPGDLVQAHDLTPAMEYGKLVTLLEPGPVTIDLQPVIRQFQKQLKSFNDEDFIVAIGDPAIIAAATMVAGSVNRGRAKLLRWDRRQRKYLELQIDLYERSRKRYGFFFERANG